MERFGLSVIQADAILDMQLQRLTGLERQKIVDDLREIKALIAELRDILSKPQRIDQIIKEELAKLRADHADPRRTEIIEAVDEITLEDMIADEDVAISITHSGYIKRTCISSYRSQRRGGRGRVGMKTRDEDFVDNLFIASHAFLPALLHRPRPGLLAEGPRHSRRGAAGQGQGHREPRLPAGGREDGRGVCGP